MAAKWMPSGMGAEPKKVAILVVLLAMAPVAYWYGNSDTPTSSAPVAAPRASVPVVPPGIPTPRPAARAKATRAARGGTEDFRPTLNLPDDFDLSKVDPTLRTDLLAKVRGVGEAGGSRSLFEFYTPPSPPPPKVDPIKPTTPVKPVAEPPKQQPPANPVKVSPPIPLKYSGYEGSPRAGKKLRGVFVDGEDHFLAGDNDMIRNRYRIVRIGTTSAEVEDTVSKSTQTLRIVERSDP